MTKLELSWSEVRGNVDAAKRHPKYYYSAGCWCTTSNSHSRTTCNIAHISSVQRLFTGEITQECNVWKARRLSVAMSKNADDQILREFRIYKPFYEQSDLPSSPLPENTSHPDTDIRLGPHSRAISLDRRIPSHQLRQRNAILCLNHRTILPRRNKVEFLAIVDHTRLGWGWCFDAVAGIRWSRCVSDYRDTSVRVGPQAGTGAARLGVPG